jgi:hypothetical protein
MAAASGLGLPLASDDLVLVIRKLDDFDGQTGVDYLKRKDETS